MYILCWSPSLALYCNPHGLQTYVNTPFPDTTHLLRIAGRSCAPVCRCTSKGTVHIDSILVCGHVIPADCCPGLSLLHRSLIVSLSCYQPPAIVIISHCHLTVTSRHCHTHAHLSQSHWLACMHPLVVAVVDDVVPPWHWPCASSRRHRHWHLHRTSWHTRLSPLVIIDIAPAGTHIHPPLLVVIVVTLAGMCIRPSSSCRCGHCHCGRGRRCCATMALAMCITSLSSPSHARVSVHTLLSCCRGRPPPMPHI